MNLTHQRKTFVSGSPPTLSLSLSRRLNRFSLVRSLVRLFGSLSAQEQLTVEMAFYGRLGSLMRQTISQPSGQVPMASMLNTIRCMSSTKLTIKGLSFGTNDESLKDASSGFGWKIGLPKSRVLYTVLRSPHVDKKSREQFEMVTKKKLLVMNTDSHELGKKLFWLKRQRIFGTQCEILVSCKTRLDKGQVVDALQRSSPTGIQGDQEGLVASSAVSAMDGQPLDIITST